MYYATEYNNEIIADGFDRAAVIASTEDFLSDYFEDAVEEDVVLVSQDDDENETRETVTIFTTSGNGAAYPTIWNKQQTGVK